MQEEETRVLSWKDSWKYGQNWDIIKLKRSNYCKGREKIKLSESKCIN